MSLEAAPRLVAVLLHQRDAPLDARERFAVSVEAAGSPELVPFVTCHRVEVYAALVEGRSPVVGRLGLDDVPAAARIVEGTDAARHLFRVALGLDSALVGEAQVLSQIRRTYEAARARGVAWPLAALFQSALRLGRTIRAGGPLGTVRRSIGSLAVDAALAEIAAPQRATVLVVGAGEIGKLAARALARRVGRVLVANRDPERARAVAEAVGGTSLPLSALAMALRSADAVISAADTRGDVLTAALLAERLTAGPLVLIDIAVPRSVPPEARELAGLTYKDVDDIAERAELPAPIVAEAEARCAAAAEAFAAALGERAAVPTIRALRARADAQRRHQLARALRRLGHLSERDRSVVDALARALTNALVHEPTVALRTDARRAEAARALFGLGE